MIELFSDTKTKPTAAMRTAMANAEVGDERAGEDPTVNRLVERCAALLGKEAALYLPSGTMCNEIALAVHCRSGDEVLCDATSHIIGFEGGGPAALAGVMLNPIAGARGIFSADQLREKLHPDRPYAPRQRLVEVEQTSNLGGGAVWPLAALHEVAHSAHAAGLATHGGARGRGWASSRRPWQAGGPTAAARAPRWPRAATRRSMLKRVWSVALRPR